MEMLLLMLASAACGTSAQVQAPPDNVKWLVQTKNNQDLRQGDNEKTAFRTLKRQTLAALRKSKVPFAKQAARTALQHKLKSQGVLAQESWKVIRLGQATKTSTFAKRGDFIWVVRFEILPFSNQGTAYDRWVNARTTAVMVVKQKSK